MECAGCQMSHLSIALTTFLSLFVLFMMKHKHHSGQWCFLIHLMAQSSKHSTIFQFLPLEWIPGGLEVTRWQKVNAQVSHPLESMILKFLAECATDTGQLYCSMQSITKITLPKVLLSRFQSQCIDLTFRKDWNMDSLLSWQKKKILKALILCKVRVITQSHLFTGKKSSGYYPLNPNPRTTYMVRDFSGILWMLFACSYFWQSSEWKIPSFGPDHRSMTATMSCNRDSGALCLEWMPLHLWAIILALMELLYSGRLLWWRISVSMAVATSADDLEPCG